MTYRSPRNLDTPHATYGYDSLNRLVSVSATGRSASYTYDNLGNRLTKVEASTTTYAYDDASELTGELRPGGESVDYLYDANGNLTAAISNLYGTTTYAYNNNNQLVKVTKPTASTIEFTYDSGGERVGKKVDGAATSFAYDSRGNLVLEANADKTVKVKYIRNADGRALAMQESGVTYYFLYNGHGDVTGVINSSGTVVATYKYDEFGNLLASTGALYNPMRYSAANNAYFDDETGLYLMGARYYNPRFGRWMTRDKAETDSAYPATYQNYVYVDNDPLTDVDPAGFFARKVLAVPAYSQEGNGNICYAAAMKQVIAYTRHPKDTPSKAAIVRAVEGRSLAKARGATFKQVKQGFYLKYKIGSWTGCWFKYKMIRKIIDGGSPIYAAVTQEWWRSSDQQWVSNGNHVQVIKGYSTALRTYSSVAYDFTEQREIDLVTRSRRGVFYNDPADGAGHLEDFYYFRDHNRDSERGLWYRSLYHFVDLR